MADGTGKRASTDKECVGGNRYMPVAGKKCKQCRHADMCAVAHLPKCLRKRAWAGDARYPIPADCPAKS